MFYDLNEREVRIIEIHRKVSHKIKNMIEIAAESALDVHNENERESGTNQADLNELKAANEGAFQTCINMGSRQGIDKEFNEMMAFAKLAEELDLAKFIHQLFYDSNANICEIEITTGDSLIIKEIRKIAKKSITQFNLDGSVGHGNMCPCGDCEEDRQAQ